MTNLNQQKNEKLIKGPLVLYEQMRRKVLHIIQERNLQPHDPVPSEGELADMFGVSRRTSKQALELLAEEGIVYRMPRRGTFLARQLNDDDPSVSGKVTLSRQALGIVVPSLDDYSGAIVAAAQQRALEFNCELYLRVTNGSQQEEENALEDLTERTAVDGILYFPGDRKSCGTDVLKLYLSGYPIVLIDRIFKEINIPAVYHDHELGALEMTDYLLKQGHRQIGYISEPIEGIVSREERYHGFLKSFAIQNLAFSTKWLFEDVELQKSFTGQQHHVLSNQSVERLQQFISSNTQLTALFCANDYLALTAMHVASAMGIRVPEELSVVGFTDLTIASHGLVPLTTVRKPPEELGVQAVDLLLSLLNGESKTATSLKLNPQLIIRNSAAEVRK